MAISNREHVDKSMDPLGAGLAPFVERELKLSLGEAEKVECPGMSPFWSRASPVRLL
jgi:hypothetical protein